MTTPTVAALAREIAHLCVERHHWRPYAGELVQSIAEEVLTRALPVGRAVVEVTGEDVQMVSAYFDRDLCGWLEDDVKAADRFAELLNERLRWPERAGLTDAELRARAPQSDTVSCRVVRRKTTTVSALVVPEDGVYAYRLAHAGSVGNLMAVWIAGRVVSDEYDAIRRIDTAAPTTWITRTMTEVPQAWTAGDIPAGIVVIHWAQGGVCSFDAGTDRAGIARDLNAHESQAVYILPECAP